MLTEKLSDLQFLHFLSQFSAVCVYNDKIYNKNEFVTIGNCLAQMECLGFNAFGPYKSLGSVFFFIIFI